MPQMAPLNWLILFMYFIFIFLIFIIINYFFLMKSPVSKKIKNNKLSINWKW